MSTYPTILDELRGGDRRSIGRTHKVVAAIRRQPALFPDLIDGMHHDDELVRMRAADAVEKLTVTNPEWLQPFKVSLIKLAARTTQQELRWHLAQVLPRLRLSRRDRVIVLAVFRRYVQDESRIVKTFAMQGLVDLAIQEHRLLVPVRRLISSLTRTGSPSMKSRGRKLLSKLNASTVPRYSPLS
ncbi:MAG: hypothetical protein HP496_06185 [Nitrospira sp.]|nr:hypothetical protein [Nitrospira sp.]